MRWLSHQIRTIAVFSVGLVFAAVPFVAAADGCSITASPATIAPGQSTTLSWVATACLTLNWYTGCTQDASGVFRVIDSSVSNTIVDTHNPIPIGYYSHSDPAYYAPMFGIGWSLSASSHGTTVIQPSASETYTYSGTAALLFMGSIPMPGTSVPFSCSTNVVVSGNTVDITCPDGSPAPNNDVSQCPVQPQTVQCPDGSPAPHNDVSQCQTQRHAPQCPDGSPAPGGDPTRCPGPGVPLQCPSGYTLNSSGQCVPSACVNSILSFFNRLLGQCQPVSPVCPANYTLGSDNLCHQNVLVCPTGETLQGGVCVPTSPPSCPSGEVYQNGQCVTVTVIQTCAPSTYCSDRSVCIRDAQCGTACTVCPYGCTNGTCNVPPALSATFRVSPVLVRQGSTVALSWSSVSARSCSVTGTDSESWSGVSGNQTSVGIQAATIFTIVCNAIPGASPASFTRSITVNIVPTFNER